MKRTLAIVAVLFLAACEGPHLGWPWDWERMIEQPRYDAYAASPFFADGMAMRTPPVGTVPYRAVGTRAPLPTTPPGDTIPLAVDAALLASGRERFDIVCAPCHGLDGSARTPVAASMTLRPPPSLHEPRLRALGPGALHRIVAEGYGLMPSYAPLLDVRARWAVVAYVQALQRSQNALLAELPPELRDEAAQALRADAEER